MNEDAPNYQPHSDTAPVADDKPQSPSSEERMFGMLSHLFGIFTCFVGPLVIWLIKKDESEFVDDQAKEALNFQLTVMIGYLINFALMSVCIGYFTFMAWWATTLIFGIFATVAANKGERYRYPINFRIIP